VLLLCLAATIARGAGNAGEKAADFPPGEFSDGGRYSLADLKGKAIVLYMYEKG
jgi:peroxiredoxin